MLTIRLSAIQLNKYQIIKGASVLVVSLSLLVAGYMAYRLWQPVMFQTTGGATPQEKVLNEALELLTSQTDAMAEPPGN